MVKFQVRRWSERPRMLVFMLGVMLPAAALIAVGVWHLRTIQREKSIEAVIQREYQQVLAIAEKRIDARAYEIAEEASSKFPIPCRQPAPAPWKPEPPISASSPLPRMPKSPA